MLSLEAEIIELQAAGLVTGPLAQGALALERGTLFSVYEELRAALYLAVAAILAGLGLVLKDHLDRIGPTALMLALALAAALCYASALRTGQRRVGRSVGGEYLLLLGTLVLSADLAYAEAQFHWFGAQWSWHLLLLAVIHAATAYYFESPLVLSVSVASLAGWLGVQGQTLSLLPWERLLHQSGWRALSCATLLVGWREAHRRLGGARSFLSVLDHAACNLACWGALAWCVNASTRVAGLAVLGMLALFAIRVGLRRGQELFVTYGIGYASLGLCLVEAQVIDGSLATTIAELVTVVVAAALLWRCHGLIRAAAT